MSGRLLHRIGAVAAGIALILAVVSLADARGRSSSRPHFDYYLLSLSWSPTYCQAHPDETRQCGRKGYGFVLHGLWPQSRGGAEPQHCATSQKPNDAVVEAMLPIMPSRRLIEHEWETHGACTGLEPKDYFDQAKDAFSRIKIPAPLNAPAQAPRLSAEEIVQAFAAINPGLDETMISVQCREGQLEEVRICLDKDNLSVRACGGRVRNACRAGKLIVPLAR